MKILLSAFYLLFVIFQIHSQEVEVKIKEGGEFSFQLNFNNITYNGMYKGSFIKTKINGDKLKIPYGKGRFSATDLDYNGDWKDGVFSGQGILFNDSITYVGFFDRGKFNGQGKIDYITREKSNENVTLESIILTYEGSWFDNKKNGYGTLRNLDNEIYEGNFSDDKFNGAGKYFFLKNLELFQKNTNTENRFNTYEGNFLNGAFDNEGKITFKDGFVMSGLWKNEVFTGKGRMFLSNGSEWLGEINENQILGEGVLRYLDGNIFEGNIKDGKKNGFGTFKYTDGSVYKGEWSNNDINGQGIFIFKNGTIWNGTWKDGLPFDKGQVDFPGFGKYQGEWSGEITKDDYLSFFINGFGIMKYSNGSVYEGYWKRNLRHGKGKYLLTNGSKQEGEFYYNNFVITIGNQEWAAENLNVDRFQNGDIILQVNSYQELENSIKNKIPAYCYLDFNSENGNKYGKLYNHFALSDPRGLAEKGWKIPSNNDFNILINYLGGGKEAFNKLKAEGNNIFTKNILNINLLSQIKKIEYENINLYGLENYMKNIKFPFSTDSINLGNNISGFNALPGYLIWSDLNVHKKLIEIGGKSYLFSFEGESACYLTSDNGLLMLQPITEESPEGGLFEETDAKKYILFGSVRLIKE